jgi:hypothetical protein
MVLEVGKYITSLQPRLVAERESCDLQMLMTPISRSEIQSTSEQQL